MIDDDRKPNRSSGGLRLTAGALAGAVSGFAALAVAELVSAAVRPQAGPVVAVGGAAIDRTPPAVKDWAIRNFGTDDKLVLQLGILAVLALFAIALGILALRFRRAGAAGVLLFGVVGALAAATRPDARGPTTPCRPWWARAPERSSSTCWRAGSRGGSRPRVSGPAPAALRTRVRVPPRNGTGVVS